MIINSIWIIDMKNSVPEKFIINFHVLFPWSSGGTVDYKFQFYWSQVGLPDKTATFSYNFLLGGYFCSSKYLGPEVANFELMINSNIMNRV